MKRGPSLLLCFLVCVSVLITPLSVEAAEPTVYINPPSKKGLLPDETFPVNVTVADVTLLFSWEFQLYYRSGILNASNWTPGPEFTSPNAVIFSQSWTDNYNETHGQIDIVCTFGGQRTFNGTTTLATLYFKVKSLGTTLLHLQDTLLLDNTYPFPQDILHTTVDGMVSAGTSAAVPGDVNGDGTVDIYDAILLSGAYSSNPSSPNWNPDADINGDQSVDIYDAIILAGHYGEKA